MKEPVRVLDPRKMALRMFYMDVAAFGLLVVGALFLGSDLYFLGRATEYGGDLLATYPGILLRVPIAGGVFALSLGWIAYRTLGQAYRNVTRVV
ncbi:MAG TPA: hypothetical protein VI997_12160 [Candidatus Thermoplasmatota archaeon]|nr:hypothetical protein [Candidatus Thermoplasmatota archaeon]